MEVIVAKTAGFCFGVKRAVDKVYENVNISFNTPDDNKKNVYTFGPIIHNEEVVNDLSKKGVKVLETDADINDVKSGVIVVRAHGASKTEFEKLKNSGLSIEDATCPFVSKIYRIVENESKEGRTVIIVGNKDHPEVKGIKGWSGEDTFIVGNVEEAQNFSEKATKISIVAQTTFNLKKFQEIVEIFEKKGYDIRCLNTICNATEVRQNEAREIASKVDAMIVIGGKNSSNTQKLFEICKEKCSNTYYIQTADDMDFSLLRGLQVVGITAGASTPKKIIEEVQTRCQN